jgi:hypothetical protein
MLFNRKTRIYFESKWKKKFYDKVRQLQELSEHDNPNDVNYGARMAK